MDSYLADLEPALTELSFTRADEEGKDLVWMAVDGVCRVFEMQVRRYSASRSVRASKAAVHAS